MPFTHLLWKCLLPGKTSVGEGRKTARLEREAEECVLAFRIDNPDFRTAFDLQDKPVCDGLFFFKKSRTEPVLLLVELKGSDFPMAVKQLDSTLPRLKEKLAKYPSQFRAVIITDRGVPTQQKGRIREFEQKHKTKLKVSHRGDLRSLI